MAGVGGCGGGRQDGRGVRVCVGQAGWQGWVWGEQAGWQGWGGGGRQDKGWAGGGRGYLTQEEGQDGQQPGKVRVGGLAVAGR